MKRSILSTLLTLSTAVTALAIPAKPGKFTYTQPDGTTLVLERHGDEFFHWTTDEAGRFVQQRADGFYEVVEAATLEAAREQGIRRRQMADAERGIYRSPGINRNAMTEGTRRIPVLLVQFPDRSFVINDPKSSFDNLLNQEGYSANGATGSVNDFYQANSHGRFDPVFDVYGPVTLPNNMAYYGDPDENAAYAVRDAAQMLDSEIDFSQYDYDQDGTVDMVLLYYAGYNEAEGGPEESIWPHQWNVRYAGVNSSFDGKRLGRYFCTSELKGKTGSNMCGIGTTCHEFGHSLGLPDFYDTNYSENGSAGALYSFSTMCSGSYNNNGRTPPFFNAEERIILDWMSDDDIKVLLSGRVSLPPVDEDAAYKTPTTTDGEYFVYEFRSGKSWDAPLPTGMVVYHVDKSRTRTVNGYTPYNLWYNWESTNAINAYGSHPCFYIVPAASQTSLNYNGSLSTMVFPGTQKVTTYNPVDWAGQKSDYVLSEIQVSGDKVLLHVSDGSESGVRGTVKNLEGKVIPEASVALTLDGATYETATASDGTYEIGLDIDAGSSPATLTVSCLGYTTATVQIALSKGFITHDFILEPEPVTLATMGFNAIDPGTGEYESGQYFALKLLAAEGNPPQRTQWYYDGTFQGSVSVRLTSGKHVVRAELTYPDGSTETLELEIKVE